MSKKFNKKEFINDVKANVRTLYRKNLDEATQQQIFQAVSYTVKDTIIDNWLATQEQYEKDDPKFSITAAYTYAPARKISIYDYSQIIFSTILGFLIFGEVPDVYSFVGYGLIIAASFFMFLYNQKRDA